MTEPSQELNKIGLELNKVYNMDCLQGLKLMPDCSVDLIVIDPPYGIGWESGHSKSEAYKARLGSHEWHKEFDFTPFFPEYWRVLKEDCFMYVFGRHDNLKIMQSLGCHRYLVWDKKSMPLGDLTDWGGGYEWIFLFKKGRPWLRGKRINGVINLPFYGGIDNMNACHPTMKPIKLIRLLIEKSSDPGQLVLDGFMGSGTTALAARACNREFIGFEIDRDFCDKINNRLRQRCLWEIGGF